MRVIDLSHPISSGMPVYPGSSLPCFEVVGTYDRQGYLERRVAMNTHTGTHCDAPSHVLPGGRNLSELPAERLAGPAMVFGAERLAEITREMLQAREEDLRAADFLLLNTGWDGKWGSKGYFSGFPVLTPEAAEFLAESGLKGLGVDAVSVDPAGAEDLFVHRTLLGAGMLIVENLRGLGELPAFGFTFVCAPLPLSGADGAPVRALALV